MIFGFLDRYSSFSFENNMKSVIAMLRKHECILAQIVRRIIEEEKNSIKKWTSYEQWNYESYLEM